VRLRGLVAVALAFASGFVWEKEMKCRGVMAAVGHEAVDRVPIDFGAMRSTGIMVVA
jgi:hypothetical protein